MIAWVFVPSAALGLIKLELLKLLPQPQTTNLQTVLPWLYCTYDRKPDADIAVKDGEHGQSKEVPNS
ncbi:hypothetical protein QA649_05140 [Bradyrhizobium sp. CB1717]|uniref:hypothetical protein n=1 Tax=Bradyrhizobium sp. CB1717 TaxID=3039154 RepID=UPI0024B076E9|nr:hypothetical protein [Bradyrhizobium sp. CB1717]WFU25594.1 hypothetical protein QA649_05140 [Bradyrhizobium sp. CB1717]